MTEDVLLRVENWLLNESNRMLVLVALAYLSAIASIASFVFVSESGRPTRVETVLIIVATSLLIYLSFRFERE